MSLRSLWGLKVESVGDSDEPMSKMRTSFRMSSSSPSAGRCVMWTRLSFSFIARRSIEFNSLFIWSALEGFFLRVDWLNAPERNPVGLGRVSLALSVTTWSTHTMSHKLWCLLEFSHVISLFEENLGKINAHSIIIVRVLPSLGADFELSTGPD